MSRGIHRVLVSLPHCVALTKFGMKGMDELKLLCNRTVELAGWRVSMRNVILEGVSKLDMTADT